MDNQPQIKIYKITGATAFWRGLIVHDTARIEAVNSAQFDRKSAIEISGYENWQVDAEPLIWHSADRKQAMVNAQFFGDLNVINLTSIKENCEIGVIKEQLMQHWTYDKILDFLFTTSLIRTFIHTNSVLERVEQTGDTGDAVCEDQYDARHYYYTSRKVTVGYKFAIRYHSNTGVLEAEPLPTG